jgi:formate C-acetyltransferase
LGLKTGATPDGRRANTPLSRGVSPSEFIKTESPLNIIHSLKKLDFTRFGESFITEITLPALEDTPEHRGVLTAVIRAFLEAEGSSLQFNLLNKQRLLEAEAHPEQHKDLLVRVCGYSAPFVALNDQTRREILRRAIR